MLVFVNLFAILFVSYFFLWYHKYMKNKALSIFGFFFKVLNILIALASLAGLTLIVLNEFELPIDFEPLKYVYVVMYELLLPFIYMLFGNIATLTINNIVSVGVCTSVALLLLSIVAFRDTSKATGYISYPNKKVSYIWVGIYSFVLCVLFGFSLILTGVEYTKISTFLAENSASEITTIVIIIKAITLSSLAILISLAMLIALIANRSKGQKRVKDAKKGLSFYSKEYEEKAQESKMLNKNTDPDELAHSKEAAESNPKAQNLINRIMELNKSLENGEITDVEYTRLRQIALRRYRK